MSKLKQRLDMCVSDVATRNGGYAPTPHPSPPNNDGADNRREGRAANLWRSGLEAQSINTLSIPARCTAWKLKLNRRAVSHNPLNNVATRGSRVRWRLTTWTSDSLSTTNTTWLFDSAGPYSTAAATGQKNSPHCISALRCWRPASPLLADQQPERTVPGLMAGGIETIASCGHDSKPYANPDVDASDAKTNGVDAGARHAARPFQSAMCARQ